MTSGLLLSEVRVLASLVIVQLAERHKRTVNRGSWEKIGKVNKRVDTILIEILGGR